MAEAAIRTCKKLKGCETFGDLVGGDRRYILQEMVGGVEYGEMRSGFSHNRVV
jgi:hypothetical protein